MRSLSRAATPHLVLLVAVLSAASCTAILGIGGDFKQGSGGAAGATSSGSGGASSTGSHTGGSTSTQGMGGATTSGSGGSAGSGGAGGDPQCTNCIEANCSEALHGGTGGGGGATTGCLNDPACASWDACLKSCGDSACATTCDQTYNVATLYKPVYACACSACTTDGGEGPCAAIDPCAHPCTPYTKFTSTPGEIYCPFLPVDAGTTFCTAGNLHCCAPLMAASSCEPNAIACTDSSDRDWHCDEPADCGGATPVCCANAPSGVTFADTPVCETNAPNITGTLCESSCHAAQQQIQVCATNSDCKPGQTCWPVKSHGMNLQLCH